MACLATRKKAEKYVCLDCDYFTSKKSNFEAHKTTRKHRLSQDKQHLATFSNETKNIFICDVCGKRYCDRSCLWRDMKRCFLSQQHKNQLNNTIINGTVNVILSML